MHLRSLLIATLSAAMATSCAALSTPRKARLLPYEAIHKKIRKFVELRPGYRLATCGRLVFHGQMYPPFGEYDPAMEIVLADGPANYFDNHTGETVAQCSYWYCVKHNRFCDLSCPPREWTCEGIEIEPLANKSPEGKREE